MRLAWAIGTTMLVVDGSTMHAMQASSEAMDEEYTTIGRSVKRTDVPPPPNLRAEGGTRTHTSLHSTVFEFGPQRPMPSWRVLFGPRGARRAFYFVPPGPVASVPVG